MTVLQVLVLGLLVKFLDWVRMLFLAIAGTGSKSKYAAHISKGI